MVILTKRRVSFTLDLGFTMREMALGFYSSLKGKDLKHLLHRIEDSNRLKRERKDYYMRLFIKDIG